MNNKKMKFMFFLSIFSLFFFSIIKCKKCEITADDLLLSKLESNSNYISLNGCNKSDNYTIKLKVDIPETNFDLLKFELETNPNISNPQIYFYLKSDDQKEFKKGSNIELKLSEITFGSYYLKITFNNKFKKKLSGFYLENFFSFYENTKRLKDNDQFTLYPGNITNLIYEYGLSEDKIIIFKVLGNTIKDFNFKYEINNEIKAINKTFFNGYSLIITRDLFSKVKNKTIKFYFEDNDEQLDISTSLKNDEDKIINTTNNHFDIIIFDKTENYIINLDIKDSEKYIFKFTTYSKNVRAIFNNDDSKQLEINEESSYFILDNINKYTEVIFHNMGNENYVTLSFDVLYLGNNSYNIIRGLPQRNILYYNMTALYKPDYYSSKSKKAVINSYIIKGHPNFYYYTNTNDNGRIISDINGFISFKYTIDKENPIYAKVECPSEECTFDIDMKSTDEFTYLKKDYKMYCFLEKSDIDKYQINVNNINEKDYLLINIHYPIQPPNVTIDNLKKNSDEYKINLIENVISYNIPIEEIDREKSDNIFINITTNNSVGIYYGINYQIKEENNKKINIENGIAYLIDLENDINSKIFIVRQNPDSQLIINLNTFGNDLVLKIDDGEYTPKNNLIHIELNKNEEEIEKYYSLNIRNNSKINEQYINLYIYEPSSDSKIFIQEGIEYNNKLTNNNNELSYYLHLNKRKEYTLYFSKYSNSSNIKITINNEPSKIINKELELIDINQNECLNEICELLIKIEKEKEENDEKDIDFSFQIKGIDQINIYRNTFINGIIEKGETIIYNGTYKDNDELFIDFLEGEGEATLKIANETIEMDYYNKKFNLSENNCYNSSCEFKLVLVLKNKNDINSKYKYNILFRDNSSCVSIPAFETIYGVLKNDGNEHKYSIKNISEYYNYELDCNFCEFKEENRTGDEIIFSIKSKEKQEINYDVYYNFRINFYDNESVILYHLNSLRNHHYCEINKDNPCYYLVHIEQYNEINYLQFLVQNIQNAEIFWKRFESGEKEEDIYQQIVNNKIGNYKNNPGNYLNLENNYQECNILLKITSNNEFIAKVNLVYDIFKRDYLSTKNIYKDDFCFINLEINKILNIELTNTKEEYYILDINLIQGKEKIEINKNDNSENKIYYLKEDFKDNFNFFSSLNNNYNIQLSSVEADTDTNTIIYYRKIKSKNKSIIKEINYGKSNYLIYEQLDEIPFQSFYINLNDASIKNEDIHLNYKYFEISNQYPDDLSLELLMVDEDFIIREKEGLNNDNSFYTNLNDITYYQKDMGAGYALLNINSIVENIGVNINYLYIKLNNKPKQEFVLVITLTDFSQNNTMPINIYLFMLIKDEKIISIINQKQSSVNSPFIEISKDNKLNVNCKIRNSTINGKTFYINDEGGNINLLIKNIDEDPVKMPNLLIKRGFLPGEGYTYFSLNDSKINYHAENKSISFYPVTSRLQDYSVIYNILIYEKDINNNILEKTKPIVSKAIKDKNSEIIFENINETLIGMYGTFSINILAEAKTKDEENEDYYEYLLYGIKKTETNINISEKEDMIIIGGAEDAENVRIKANISIDDKDITKYKFVKLILITYNKEDTRKKFEIYASSESSFLTTNDDDLYEASEFKSVDSYNNTVLTVPLESCKARKLYIQIPCREMRNLKLIYRIEDGRKMEGITIHENTCFDILLKDIKSDNLNYRFVYTIIKGYHPLITFTTYEINDEYELFTTGLENAYLKKFFKNGYAFVFKYTGFYFEYYTFIIRPNVTTIFRICHRIIEDNEEEIEKFTPVSIGENIYSALRNKRDFLKDCFKIEKNGENEYEKYMFSYISKSQNMKLKIIGNNNEPISLFHESGNIFLKANEDKFCLCLREEAEDEEMDGDFHGSINFQIYGINNQNSTAVLMPLINGYFVNQTLLPGQMIYYRSYKYKINSKYLKMHFEKLKGTITIGKSNCQDYPKKNNFGESKTISDAFYLDNYYDEEQLNEDETEVYNKAKFLVYSVKCENSSNKAENCNFYIGLHNEGSSLSLTENRKIYFKSRITQTLNFSTEFYSETYIEKREEEEERNIAKKYYLEIHLLEGKLDISKAFINGSNIWHNFDNKTYYYSSQPYGYYTDVGFFSLINNLVLEKDTLIYISYRVLPYKNNGARKDDYFYNIYEEEMHYNILTPSIEKFTYNYNNSQANKYIVSIFGINSDILVDNSIDQMQFYQFPLQKNVTDIICILNNIYGSNHKKQCEFIFSFSELKNDTIYKKVEFDGIEQSYKINEEIKNICLYYNLTNEDLKNEYILITIKKDNLCYLKIEYGLKNTYDIEYFQNLSHSIDTKKMVDIFRIKLNQPNKENKIRTGESTKKILMFKLSAQNESIYEFKIRINIKNNPIYLGPKEIEFGSIKLNEPLYYYYDYYSNEEKGSAGQFEEIYLFNKGNVKMKVAALEYSEEFPYNPHDVYKIIYDDNYFNYTGNESRSNHIKITNIDKKEYTLGLRIYIKVYLEKNENIDANYYYNSFSICRHSQILERLLVKLNYNMFGNIYDTNNKEKYNYYTNNISNITGSLIINLNCLNCKLVFYNFLDKDIQLTTSYILNIDNSSLDDLKDNIKFDITGEKGYYYFSLSDSNSPRYIEESEPQLCLGFCKFIFPLYNFSNYSTNTIIFFSPDIEKVNIQVTTVNKPEKEEILPVFKEDNITENFNNKLFYDINKNDIEQEKYLKIYVASADKNQIFHFIMSKFINSENTNDIKHTKQIISIKPNYTDTNIFSIDEDDKNFFYQFDFQLLSGNGNVIIKGEKEYIYKLDYEYHPYISAIIKLSNYSISSQNPDPDKNFTFFFNVTKLGENYEDITTQLDYAKNYRIKYYLNEYEDLNIFPLNLKISCKQGYTTFASYRFVNLEFSKRADNPILYNTSNNDFVVEPKDDIDENLISVKSKFFHDFQRGVISANPTVYYKENYINLTLKQSDKNQNEYKNLFLEISFVFLKNNGDEIIDIPKNSYVQFDLNTAYKEYTLAFIENDIKYNFFQIEIANTTDPLNITYNFEKCDSEKIYGKRTYICHRNTTVNNTFSLISDKPVTVLVKYTTRQNKYDFPKFYISNATLGRVIKDPKKENDNSTETKVDLTYPKIDAYNNVSNEDSSYFVRLYDYLKFNNNSEVDSILINFNGNISYRMDCDKSQTCGKKFSYEANFGNLSRASYFISIIGEVKFNDSVEYLSYEPFHFRLDNKEDPKFQPKWIIPLVFVLLMFCAIVGYIIYINIKEYKQKKGKKKEGVADILINDGDKGKNMLDIKDEENDDDKDKEDDDDEDNNDDDNPNENLIKV